MNKRYYDKAFTLVELMVTLAIATILLAIAVPSFTDFYENSRSEAASSNIQQSLFMARSHAISYGATVTVCPRSGSKCGTDWINGFDVFIDVEGTGSYDSTKDQVIRTIDAFNSNDFIKTSLKSISFNSEGMISGTAGNLQFIYCPANKANANSKAIEVSVTGKIRKTTGNVNCS
ncbi:type IV pilus biogenesis protein FimU [Shewanella sp. c952]|uniref:GspH/FimT family pseudopilin n=1 Tax=Shewanella sp. c952 TaxID=2815913 RepID=UPI001BBB581D|nr:GspH/FimT family pseudopilin [Shewanella sp. c952]GIU09882.1 type IV pilus biogenesis protein FimU [Shewanella sp. c952]